MTIIIVRRILYFLLPKCVGTMTPWWPWSRPYTQAKTIVRRLLMGLYVGLHPLSWVTSSSSYVRPINSQLHLSLIASFYESALDTHKLRKVYMGSATIGPIRVVWIKEMTSAVKRDIIDVCGSSNDQSAFLFCAEPRPFRPSLTSKFKGGAVCALCMGLLMWLCRPS